MYGVGHTVEQYPELPAFATMTGYRANLAAHGMEFIEAVDDLLAGKRYVEQHDA